MSNSAIDTILNETTAFERSSIYAEKMETLGRGLSAGQERQKRDRNPISEWHSDPRDYSSAWGWQDCCW